MEREDRKTWQDHPGDTSHGSEPAAKRRPQESGSAEGTGSATAHLLPDEATQDGDTVPTVDIWSGAFDLVGSYITPPSPLPPWKPRNKQKGFRKSSWGKVVKRVSSSRKNYLQMIFAVFSDCISQMSPCVNMCWKKLKGSLRFQEVLNSLGSGRWMVTTWKPPWLRDEWTCIIITTWIKNDQ